MSIDFAKIHSQECQYENLEESQYIAPFNANFQEKFHWTKMFSFDNGSVASFTWYNMTLRNTVQDSVLQFTFQVNLFPTGKIQLVYLDFPHLTVEHVIDMKHQITMGLSDAYLIGIHFITQLIKVYFLVHLKINFREKVWDSGS